jgi:hypothetical protein
MPRELRFLRGASSDSGWLNSFFSAKATDGFLDVATERLLKLHATNARRLKRTATAEAPLNFADSVCNISEDSSDSVGRMYSWFKVILNTPLFIIHLRRGKPHALQMA